MYCVGENLAALASSNGASAAHAATKLPRAYPPEHWQAWFRALTLALQPPPLRTDPRDAEPALQFTQLYQIAREKVLGSGVQLRIIDHVLMSLLLGQFGTVFHSIHRQSG